MSDINRTYRQLKKLVKQSEHDEFAAAHYPAGVGTCKRDSCEQQAEFVGAHQHETGRLLLCTDHALELTESHDRSEFIPV